MNKAFAALLILFATPALSAECTVEQVTYIQPEAEGFSLTFRPAAEPNAWSDLNATLKTPSREYKFTLTASNGYSFNYLVPAWKDAPEDADFRLFLFDNEFGTLDLPAKGAPAPAAILTPELGSWLYYGAINADRPERDYLPVAMWRAEGCG